MKTITQTLLGTKISLAILTSLVILLFTGCAGVTMNGKTFDPKQVSTIQKGKTTKQEIRSTFGEPVSTRAIDTGEVWSYFYQSVSFMNENHSLDIDFDKGGIVTDYCYKGGKSMF